MNKTDCKILTRLWLPASLLLCGHSMPALAMGLGNIDVRSGLGQPLSAQVELYDAPQRLDAGCFRLLQSQNDLPFAPLKAAIKLQQNQNGHARLEISTYQALNEPIVLLNLVADCEQQISREYTLLLDPPPIEETTSALPPTTAAHVLAEQVPLAAPARDTARPDVSEGRSQAQRTQTDSRRKQPASRKTTSPANAQATHVAAADTAEDASPVSGTGRLVISGDEYRRPEFFDSPLQLQMSMELQEWPLEDVQALNEEAVSDEMTAMANKLAHLESQMLALQKRNAELEAQRLAAPATREEASWLNYLFITLAVLVLLSLAEWLRRRHIQRQMAAELAIWNELAPEVEQQAFDSGLDSDEPPNTPDRDRKTAPAGYPDFMAMPAILHGQDHEQAGTTVNEDILEQAEVFVAHGRANLAIVLLQDHLADFPELSPEPWLMLLDLLKRDGERVAYEAAGTECRRHFNVAIANFDAPLQDDLSSIEDFPHIVRQLQQVWGRPEAIPYLDDLIYNRRLEARQGFGRNAYLEILLLRSIAGASESGESSPDAVAVITAAANRQEIAEIETSTQPAATPLAPEIEIPASTGTPEEPLFAEELTANPLPEDKSLPLEFEFPTKN